jgi:hypothetical protein
MPTLDERIKRRIAEAEKARKSSQSTVRGLQSALYAAILEWLAGLDTNEGRIKPTVANYGRMAGLLALLQRFGRRFATAMLGAALDGAERIFAANEGYFDGEGLDGDAVAAARRRVLLRWGYDVGKKRVLSGGYFEYLFDSRAVAQRVASAVNMAIGQGMGLAEFQKQFRAVFVGKPGGGMLERHWRTVSFDLYQRLDRTANLVYAEELGLEWAIYSGTLEEDSRPFCIARVNRVYSKGQIESWKNLNFAGKPKIGYDPKVDCGGYNCRHHLSWISSELAESLNKKEQ